MESENSSAPAGWAVEGDQDAHGPLEIRLLSGSAGPRRDVGIEDPRGFADPNRPTVDDALDSVAMHLHHVGGHHEGDPALLRRPHDRAGQHVRGGLVKACRSAEQIIHGDPGGGVHSGQLRVPHRQGPGLVEQQHTSGAELLKGPGRL